MGDTPRSGVPGRLDWWRPPCQFMVLMLWSIVGLVVAGGVVCHTLMSRLLVPREPCELRLLVEIVVFPTEPPSWGPRGVCNLCDWVLFYAESIFPGTQDAPLVRGERPVRMTAAALGVARTF